MAEAGNRFSNGTQVLGSVGTRHRGSASGLVREGLTRKVNRVAAIGASWAQIPTVDDIEEFLGVDQWTLADFLWAIPIWACFWSVEERRKPPGYEAFWAWAYLDLNQRPHPCQGHATP